MMTRVDQEQFLGTVDVWQLRQMRWPILRALARRFVEQRELERYMDELLATGRWSTVRVAPQVQPDGGPPHIFQVWATPAPADADLVPV